MGVESTAASSGSSGRGRTVCVTGAGGFIASWLVKLLLQKGYAVRGTVRNPDDDAKNGHLWGLDGAAERLTLVRAELLDKESLVAAFRGCEGVFHTASPVTDDPEKMIEPAVNGTKNVIDAAADAGGVRRVVFTSSVGAVYLDPRHGRGGAAQVDEACWSDLAHCERTGNWYCYAKTAAERAAWELAALRGVDLVVVCPSLVLGPLLQPALNASAWHVLKYLDGSVRTYADAAQPRRRTCTSATSPPRARAGLRGARRARPVLCAGRTMHRGEVCRALTKMFPEYPVPTECKGGAVETVKGCRFSSRRLTELGVVVTPASLCLYDVVTSLQDKGPASPRGADAARVDDNSAPSARWRV